MREGRFAVVIVVVISEGICRQPRQGEIAHAIAIAEEGIIRSEDSYTL